MQVAGVKDITRCALDTSWTALGTQCILRLRLLMALRALHLAATRQLMVLVATRVAGMVLLRLRHAASRWSTILVRHRRLLQVLLLSMEVQQAPRHQMVRSDAAYCGKCLFGHRM